MEYINVRHASRLWGIPERRVTMLCRNGRIPGAVKQGKTWLIPRATPRPLDARTKEYASGVPGGSRAPTAAEPIDFRRHPATSHEESSRAPRRFEQIFHASPDGVAFTPYRVCPLGAHCDHQLGKITGFAIDKGVRVAYGATPDGEIEVLSLQFPRRAKWHIHAIPTHKQGDWADYLRGVTIVLSDRYPLRVGIRAVVDGELPIGGLSSSTAVMMSFLTALCRLNGILLSPSEIIGIVTETENRYVGVSCGGLDPSCALYCRRDHLLSMDMRDGRYDLIPSPPEMKPYKIAVFFSGQERSLAESKFNVRVDECRAAAYALKAYTGLPYGKIEEACLREVPMEVYRMYRDRLPERWVRRAEHFYSEYDRVVRGVRAWRRGDLETFGRLMFESGRSSIYNYETGSAELKRLYEILVGTDGVWADALRGRDCGGAVSR